MVSDKTNQELPLKLEYFMEIINYTPAGFFRNISEKGFVYAIKEDFKMLVDSYRIFLGF